MKICTKCKINKNESEFHKDKYRSDGLANQCKECRIEKIIEWNNNNKEYRKKVRARWYKKNREREIEKTRVYNATHKEEKIVYGKQYRIDNSYNLKEYDRNRYRKNKKKKLEYNKIYENKRLKEDPNYKIARNLRRRLRDALKSGYKIGSAVRDLGCSTLELKKRFESMFYLHPTTNAQMTWENYGNGWHIDHIVPLSSFDLTDREQFLKACHYTNLQPLWAEENLKKGSKH